MIRIPFFQINAFTNLDFGGNPAGVCPLTEWLPTPILQKIALENAVAETAFFIPGNETGVYDLRWFTPEIEMDLCGHATLATAHVLFHHLGYSGDSFRFNSASGPLTVTKTEDQLVLDFPSRTPVPTVLPDIILEGIGLAPSEVLKARDYVLVYEREAQIRELQPNIPLLNQINLDPGGIIVTAPGDEADFVSRFFTPQALIFEDPVTGSAHCSLIPYWSKRLNKTELLAYQISARFGRLHCSLQGDRVKIGGKSQTYMEGFIYLNQPSDGITSRH